MNTDNHENSECSAQDGAFGQQVPALDICNANTANAISAKLPRRDTLNFARSKRIALFNRKLITMPWRDSWPGKTVDAAFTEPQLWWQEAESEDRNKLAHKDRVGKPNDMSGLQKGEYQETVGRRSLTEMNDDKNEEWWEEITTYLPATKSFTFLARTKYKAPKLKAPGTPARVSSSGPTGLKPPTATPGILSNQQQCQSAGSSPVTIRKTREDKGKYQLIGCRCH